MQMTDDQPNTLLPLTAEQTKHRAIDRQALAFAHRAVLLHWEQQFGAAVSVISLFVGIPLLILLKKLPPYWFSPEMFAQGIFFFVCAALGGIALNVAVSLPLREMVKEARQSDDKRKIGVLLDSYREYPLYANHVPAATRSESEFPSREFDSSDILLTLLPQIEEEDAVLFSPAQRKILRDLLRHPDPCLIVVALTALGKVGHRSDLPAIWKVAGNASKAVSAPQVVQAAKEAAAQIEARLSQHSQTLLRAASSPEDVSDQLLRPAAPRPSQTEAAQLLRARNEDTRKDY